MTALDISSVVIIQAVIAGTRVEPRFIVLYCFFLQCAVYALVIIVAVFGVCGCVHYEARSCVREMKRVTLISGWKEKVLQRKVKALPVIKIELSSDNFVEKSTPFVYIGFVMARIVDSLLLSK